MAGLVAGGYAGANVTIPHKQAVVELCDEAEGESVNTLLFRDGRVLGYNTDKAIVAGIESRSVCLLGAGGAAKALLPALQGEVHMFSRKGDWPPDASGCDLIVNATPVRDELLVEPRPEQAVVDLAYRPDGRPTALVASARERWLPARRRRARGARAARSGVVSAVDRRRAAGQRDAHRPRLRAMTLRLMTAGESHGPALVAILSGLPAGLDARPGRHRRRPRPPTAGVRA